MPTGSPVSPKPHLTSEPPTVPSSTKKVTPTQAPSTTRVLQSTMQKANESSHTTLNMTTSPVQPNASTVTLKASAKPTVMTNSSNTSDAVSNTDTVTVPPNATQPANAKTREKRSNVDLTVESPTCMIFKYFDEDTLKVGLTWTADFSCDMTGACINQTSCKDGVQVNGKSGRLCCCHGDQCNTRDLLDRNLPHTPVVKECYTKSNNKSVPFTKIHCDTDESQFCINMTQKEETSYYCSNRDHEYFCQKHNLTKGGCYSGMLKGQESTLCCCNEDSCNADPNFIVSPVKNNHFNYNIVIYVLSTLIIVVLVITVILLLVKRRKTPMDPDMVQITYSRLTADLADG
ncbi:uncharacterized protein [Ptychodera flava]